MRILTCRQISNVISRLGLHCTNAIGADCCVFLHASLSLYALTMPITLHEVFVRQFGNDVVEIAPRKNCVCDLTSQGRVIKLQMFACNLLLLMR